MILSIVLISGFTYEIAKMHTFCQKDVSQSKQKCTEWSGISFDMCKRKCTQNEVVNDTCSATNCSYFHFNGTSGYCRLIDTLPNSCQTGTDVLLLHKTG